MTVPRPKIKAFRDMPEDFMLPVDADVQNADWLRNFRWDSPVSTLAEFWQMLGVRPDAPKTTKRKAVKRFMALPAASHLPAGIKTALVKGGYL